MQELIDDLKRYGFDATMDSVNRLYEAARALVTAMRSRLDGSTALKVKAGDTIIITAITQWFGFTEIHYHDEHDNTQTLDLLTIQSLEPVKAQHYRMLAVGNDGRIDQSFWTVNDKATIKGDFAHKILSFFRENDQVYPCMAVWADHVDIDFVQIII